MFEEGISEKINFMEKNLEKNLEDFNNNKENFTDFVNKRKND
jgi:hypothetical protein